MFMQHQSVTNNPKVSIIIPIYNVEEYLPNCIESAIGQIYRDIEILLIDDGSTDGSGRICEEYAKQDSRINVVHKENGGLSATRNLGVETATGEFVLHLDGDDTLPLNAIEILVNKQAEGDFDLVVGNLTAVYSNKIEYVKSIFIEDKQEYLGKIVGDLSFPHFVTGKLIRKNIYTKHNIRAKEGVNVGEDLQVLSKLIYFSNSYASVDHSVYNYYRFINPNALTGKITLGSIKQDIASMEIVAEFFKQNGEVALSNKMLATETKKMPEWLYILCINKRNAEFRELHAIANKPKLRPFKKLISTPYRVLLYISSPWLANCYMKVLAAIAK